MKYWGKWQKRTKNCSLAQAILKHNLQVWNIFQYFIKYKYMLSEGKIEDCEMQSKWINLG